MAQIDEPVICPVVIGRAEQVALLNRILAPAGPEQGSVVLISGDAGIGKTRLVGVARDLATSQGWNLLQGNFFEQDRAVPFGGLIDLMRSFLAAGKLDGAEVASLSPELAQLLPERADAGSGPSAAIDPDEDKRRIFLALTRLLFDQAEQRPTLVVLEDLHWADDASLDFLVYFCRLVSRHRLVLVLTFRSDEVRASLAHLLADLERERVAIELPLAGLTQTQVDGMLRATLRRERPVRSELLQHVHGLTDGNPFFIEELIRSVLADAGVADPWEQAQLTSERIPRSVNESVRRRSEQLSAQTRQVLEIAAVAGRRFDFPLLLEVSGLAEPALLGAIKELINAQLVSEDSVDSFSFRHALTRNAVYSGLLLRERRRLHAQIVETIRALYGQSLEEHSEDLAYHAFEAEDWPTAMSYYGLAGARANSLYSPRSAVEHFSRALEAATHLGSVPRREMLTQRGRAYETLGDFDAARLDHEAALSEAYLLEDRAGQWQSLLDLGMLWAGRDYDRTGDYLQRANRLADEIGDRAIIGHSLNRIGNWLVNIERPTEGVAYHLQALEIFQELADQRGLAGTLDLLAMGSLLSSRPADSFRYYGEAIAIFEQLNDRIGLASALGTMSCLAGGWQGDASEPALTLADAEHRTSRALQLSRDAGWRSGESYALWNLTFCLGPMGEYGRALETADAALAVADEIEHVQWQTTGHMARGALRLDLLDLPHAREDLQQALDLAIATKSMLWISVSSWQLASVCIQSGQLDQAQALLEPVLRDGPPWTMVQRQVRATWAELALAQGQPEAALQRIDVLEDEANHGDSIPWISRVRGLALAALGRDEAAASQLQRTIDVCLQDGKQCMVWRLHADLASLYLKRGDRAAAAVESQAAVTAIDHLAASLPEGELRAAYRSRAYQHVPGAPRSRPAAGGLPGGLSQREGEVAVLVARGLSNRAMADELVLSERTVETHVANALSKLGFSSRSQLAAWAVEQGLLAST